METGSKIMKQKTLSEDIYEDNSSQSMVCLYVQGHIMCSLYLTKNVSHAILYMDQVFKILLQMPQSYTSGASAKNEVFKLP